MTIGESSIFSIGKFRAMGVILFNLGCAALLADEPSAPAISLAAFGHRILTHDTKGDTWDGAWLADGRVLLQYDDGSGWGKTGEKGDRLRSRGIGELLTVPWAPSNPSGVDLNPGRLGDFLSWTYSTGLYEVDGVLYIIKCLSDQTPGRWRFYDHNLLKSVDGGATWINHLGQADTVPDPKQPAMFPGDATSTPKDPWRRLNFVKYGQGGTAPDVDGARTWVYLNSLRHLARVRRSDLPALDRSRFQYYTGGDGQLDSCWTEDITRIGQMQVYSPDLAPFSIVYNPGLRRYVSVSFRSDSWKKPPIESVLFLLEAPHPWGPWTVVLEEHVNYKEQDNLTWTFPLQKWISPQGDRMWMTATGRAPYALQFMPILLSTAPVEHFPAAAAALAGPRLARELPDCSRSGYVTGFDHPNDECCFTTTVGKAGLYLANLRFHATSPQSLELLVNQVPQGSLRLGKSAQAGALWTSYSFQLALKQGANTINFRATRPTDVQIDRLSLAYHSDQTPPRLK